MTASQAKIFVYWKTTKQLSRYCYRCSWMCQEMSSCWRSEIVPCNSSFALFTEASPAELLIFVYFCCLLDVPSPSRPAPLPSFMGSSASSALFPSFPSWQPHVFPASHSSFPLRDPNLKMNAFRFPTFGKQRDEFLMVIPGLSLGGLPHFLKRGG